MTPARARSALLLVTLLGAVAWLVAYGQRAAFHSDELNVLWQARRFWTGTVYVPGRPGLLFAALAPLMAFDDPVAVLHGSRWTTIAAASASLGLVAWLGLPRCEDRQRWDRQLLAPLAVLLLATAGLWGTHSIEVRTDSYTTPLTLGALAVLWSQRWRPWTVAVAAALVAAAVLCSQKSAYNTVGLGVAWLLARPTLPGPGLRPKVRDGAVAIGVGLACLTAWFVTLSLLSSAGTGAISNTVAVATATAFGGGVGWDDKVGWLSTAVQRAPILWLAAPFGLGVGLFRGDGRVAASGLVAAVLVAVMPIHRGFFPYYISSIEPLLALPAAAAILAAGGLLAKPLGARGGLIAAAVVGGLLLWRLPAQRPAFEQAWAVDDEGQRALAERVHELFPEPVPYLAGINVVPNYPEVAGYLTAQRRRGVRKRDRNFVATWLQERQARFFVRNYMTRDRYLRDAERKALYRSYLPLGSNLYVHGARLRWPAGGTTARGTVELSIDGTYTLVRRGTDTAPVVRVDGTVVGLGERIELAAGVHAVEVGADPKRGEAWLVLGEGLGKTVPWFDDHSTFPKDRKNSRSRYQRYDNKRAQWDLILLPDQTGRRNAKRNHRKRLRDLEARYQSAIEMTRD